jgi:FkbM family methyltransferase
MLVNSKSRGEFDLLVLHDVCQVRHWGLNYFDAVIDIGANVGVFSIMMRMLHPHAKIVAIEPSHRSIELLKSNVSHMNIGIDERGLGDGSVLYHKFGRKKSPVADYFTPEENEESFTIQTEPFWKLFEDNGYKVDSKLFVKIDCEGGEQYLVGDTKSEKILLNAEQVFIEIHFKAKKNIWRLDDYIPKFEFYKEWVNDVFSETHDIDLFNFKIGRGHGNYCIRKKKSQ